MDTKPLRLANYARVALRLEKATGAPAAFFVAQWALESSWGSRPSGEHNYWGLTYNQREHPSFKWCDTREVLTPRQVEALDPDEKRDLFVTQVREDGKSECRLRRRFASFPTEDDAIAAYVRLWAKPRYKPACEAYAASPKNAESLKTFISSIAASGYATDPNYAKTVYAIATQADVTRALAQARAELK